MTEYKGYVEHIIYRNEENTYTVFEVQCEDGLLTCTGFPPAISEGESCLVAGETVQHAVYGEQFKVQTYRAIPPENAQAMLRYLASGAVKGIGQALAVIPGLSRSGTTISTGLICGVKRENMAQFSFLMVLVPILGEAFLDLVGGEAAASSVGFLPLALGFLAAFVSGLFACKVMIALVRRAQLKWFGLYCAIVGLLVLIFLV